MIQTLLEGKFTALQLLYIEMFPVVSASASNLNLNLILIHNLQQTWFTQCLISILARSSTVEPNHDPPNIIFSSYNAIWRHRWERILYNIGGGEWRPTSHKPPQGPPTNPGCNVNCEAKTNTHGEMFCKSLS